MNFDLPPETQETREKVRAFLAREWPEENRIYGMNDSVAHDLEGADSKLTHLDRSAIRAFYQKMGEEGILGIGFPERYGGSGGGPLDRFVLEWELAYSGAPFPFVAIGTVAPTLLWIGDEERLARFLPPILRGESEFALGYTEPAAGSDLASITTRAIRQGDHYVINGQKLYSSGAHHADWYWLAARTDPSTTRHRGISLFVVPLDTPGITVTPLRTMSGIRTNIVFLDDVRVSAENLIGEEGGGWRCISHALAHERFTAISSAPLVRALDELLGLDRGLVHLDRERSTLTRMRANIHVANLLTLYCAWLADQDRELTAQAAATKTFVTEMRYDMANYVTACLGPRALLTEEAEGAPAEGQFNRMYMHSVITLFTAGANAVQRELIASRQLKLPRDVVR